MWNKLKSPWGWIPTLYFAQGIPYVIVMTVAVIMYKRLGISNTEIALYTSWLYLPWVIKPLWSPVVDLLKTKRWWIVTMQLIVGAGLAGVAFTIPAPNFFQYTLAFFWLLAFSSATHDIAADGFYMLALKEGEQSYFIGIRSTFYRVAMITGQGLLIIVAGFFETWTGLDPVNISVKTTDKIEVVSDFPVIDLDQPSSSDLDFIVTEKDIEMSWESVPASYADSIINVAYEHNVENGFVVSEGELAQQAGEPSWFARNISDPLSQKLAAIFNPQDIEEVSDIAGNVAIVGVTLSSPPDSDDPVVMNTAQTRGDQSIQLVSGDRLEFNRDNWNKTAFMVFQSDPRLDSSVVTHFEGLSGNIPLAWSITFFGLAALFILLFLYHKLIMPRPDNDVSTAGNSDNGIFKEFFETFSSFFKKKDIGLALSFLLLFRLGEAQIVKLASPFMLDSREIGGLGLTTGDVGLVYGTIGILALTLGGILGGLMASKKGLRYWLFPMTIAMNAPNIVFIILSYTTPESLWLISSAVAVEQFGYGFGFTAYMLFMIYFSEGKHKTAHFAICTGLMAMGMMLPGMISGWIQEAVGYVNFFIWVMICTIPGFILIFLLRKKVAPDFGIKKK
ncbi:MFS transporter [Marinilabiliaceae bacterium ANBcel2]|nr:MFS transporter [Marinilabiliaceae bacterium ANBcel2]